MASITGLKSQAYELVDKATLAEVKAWCKAVGLGDKLDFRTKQSWQLVIDAAIVKLTREQSQRTLKDAMNEMRASNLHFYGEDFMGNYSAKISGAADRLEAVFNQAEQQWKLYTGKLGKLTRTASSLSELVQGLRIKRKELVVA